ncbi:hypothetical protein V7182_23905 [Neobacillus drentensis]
MKVIIINEMSKETEKRVYHYLFKVLTQKAIELEQEKHNEEKK